MSRTSEYADHESLMVAVDCIIFGFDSHELKALLVKRGFKPGKGKWSLMGGFVKKNESVDEAASRVLGTLTGLTSVYMEQLYCFGDIGRDPGGRVVSIAYFALIKLDDYDPALMKTHQAKWFPVKSIPSVIFDHREMILLARERLRQKVSSHPIGFALLPDKFTMLQLQELYEAIYETQLDKRNFTKKILSLGILKKLKEKEKSTSKKGSFLYVFDLEKYNQLEKEGLRLV